MSRSLDVTHESFVTPPVSEPRWLPRALPSPCSVSLGRLGASAQDARNR